MSAVRRRIALLARGDLPVLLLGESGTGKGVVARALHDASGARGRFVGLNGATIPESLAESVLFGHARGAFTDAKEARLGALREADRGTVFLDEVAELPAAVQAKLLKALDEGEVIPVGGGPPCAFAARLVAATNADLSAEVAGGRFRGDLLARLHGAIVQMPPLRARREDILLHFRDALTSARRIEHALAAALISYDWPFNVRELGQVAKQAELFSPEGGPLLRRAVADRLLVPAAAAEPRPESDAAESPDRAPSRDEVTLALRACGGVVAKVARRMGRSRKQVYRWLEKYEIDPDSFRIESE